MEWTRDRKMFTIHLHQRILFHKIPIPFNKEILLEIVRFKMYKIVKFEEVKSILNRFMIIEITKLFR